MTIHGKKCSCRACKQARINHKRRTTGTTSESESLSASENDELTTAAEDE